MTDKKQDLQITKFNEETKGLSQAADQLKVTDELSLKKALDFGGQVKNKRDEIEEGRKFFTKPLNVHIRNINAKFKPMITLLDKLEKIVKASIAKYRQKQEDDRIKEEARLRKLAQKRFDKAKEKAEDNNKPMPVYVPPVLAPTSNTVQAKNSSMLEKEVPDYEVIDEFQVPFKYTMLNHIEIRKDVRRGVKEISGIRIFMKKQINILR